MKFRIVSIAASLLIAACSSSVNVSTPEEAATIFVESLIKHDEALMKDIVVSNTKEEDRWREISALVSKLQNDPKRGDVSYEKTKCWIAHDTKDTFCDFSILSATKRVGSITVKVPQGQLKVAGSAIGD